MSGYVGLDPNSDVKIVDAESIARDEEQDLKYAEQWNPLADYVTGQEVISNGYRYIARLPSGPNNGGAVVPGGSQQNWDSVVPQGYSTVSIIYPWIKIAVIFGIANSEGDALELEVIVGSALTERTRFTATITMHERFDAVRTLIIPMTRSVSSDPEFYVKKIGSNRFELWMKRITSAPSAVTVIKKSRSRSNETVAGILELTSSEPAGITLVNYDTDYQYASIPIGLELPLDTAPPMNDPRFRFIKLTHGDAYNTGLVTSQTLTGAAPELVSTAVISDARSPLNGQTVHLINTMGTFIRPGIAANVRQLSGNRSHAHAIGVADVSSPGGARAAEGTGNVDSYPLTNMDGGDEARPYNLSKVFYKRIW